MMLGLNPENQIKSAGRLTGMTKGQSQCPDPLRVHLGL